MPREKGEASPGCAGRSRGLGLLHRDFPLPRSSFPVSWGIPPWRFRGRAASNPLLFSNVGKGKCQEVNSGCHCLCRALFPPKSHSSRGLGHPKSRPAGAMGDIPSAPIHPVCCYRRTGMNQRQPRKPQEGKFCPRHSKGRAGCALFGLPGNGGTEGSPGDTPTLGLDPSGG